MTGRIVHDSTVKSGENMSAAGPPAGHRSEFRLQAKGLRRRVGAAVRLI